MSERIWSPDVVEIGDRIAILSATEAALLNKYLADTYGIQATGMIVTPPLDDPDVIVENGMAEPVAFGIVLDGFEPARKISVIKALREHLALGLKEAKDLVDAAPRLLKERLTKPEAEQLQTQLEAAGAKMSLRPQLN